MVKGLNVKGKRATICFIENYVSDRVLPLEQVLMNIFMNTKQDLILKESSSVEWSLILFILCIYKEWCPCFSFSWAQCKTVSMLTKYIFISVMKSSFLLLIYKVNRGKSTINIRGAQVWTPDCAVATAFDKSISRVCYCDPFRTEFDLRNSNASDP